MSGAFRCLVLGLLGLLALPAAARSEDGYELWLRYPQVSNAARLAQYRAALAGVFVAGDSPTLSAARDELARGLRGLLGTAIPIAGDATRDRLLLASARLLAGSAKMPGERECHARYERESINKKGGHEAGMITRFSTLYVGHIELEQCGLAGTPADDRR